MSSESRYHPGADMQGFVRELMEFVGLDDADVAMIRRSAPAILKHEPAITAALYEHFLKFPATARFFVTEDGTPDAQRLDRRKHSLGRWLRETADSGHDARLRLSPPGRKSVAQPSCVWPRRESAAAIYGRGDEYRTDGFRAPLAG